MRFELYGIYSQNGTNYGPVVVTRSLKQAMEGLSQLNTLHCPAFAIAKKIRKNTRPIEVFSGRTHGEQALQLLSARWCGGDFDPITQEADGREYWKDKASYFPKVQERIED